jgi:Na+-transporting NADH:ubiquinone oxidoreductase subunit NqrA
MAYSEGEEARKKKKANEREQVGRTAKASGLFKGARRRPFTSYPLTEQSQEFNSDSNLLEMSQAPGAASHNTTPDGIKVNHSDGVLHLSIVSSYYFRTTRWTSFTGQTPIGHTH